MRDHHQEVGFVVEFLDGVALVLVTSRGLHYVFVSFPAFCLKPFMQINLTKGKANTWLQRLKALDTERPKTCLANNCFKKCELLTKIHGSTLQSPRQRQGGTVPEPDLAERHAVGLVELEGLAHSRESVRRLTEYHLLFHLK